jgi:hypothetical protein
MDTIAHYVPSVTPFLWWPVAIVGAWSFYRRRSLRVALVTMGSAVLAAVGTLHQLFGYGAVFDAQGKLVTETPGLLSLGAQLLWTGLGLLCVVIGLLLILWRSAATEGDA